MFSKKLSCILVIIYVYVQKQKKKDEKKTPRSILNKLPVRVKYNTTLVLNRTIKI